MKTITYTETIGRTLVFEVPDEHTPEDIGELFQRYKTRISRIVEAEGWDRENQLEFNIYAEEKDEPAYTVRPFFMGRFRGNTSDIQSFPTIKDMADAILGLIASGDIESVQYFGFGVYHRDPETGMLQAISDFKEKADAEDLCNHLMGEL